MVNAWIRSTTLALALAVAGCGTTMTAADYAAEQPVLDLKSYFNGTVDAWGIFQDRSGKVVKRFTVVMHCSWDGDTGTLDEDFTYSDGTTQKRVWTLKKVGNNRYIGTADDVIGQADRDRALEPVAFRLWGQGLHVVHDRDGHRADRGRAPSNRSRSAATPTRPSPDRRQ